MTTGLHAQPPGEPPVVTLEAAQPRLTTCLPEPPRLWETDFLLGLPTGVRVQTPSVIFDHGKFEGFLGLFAIFPSVGAGYRLDGCVFRGACDDLSISPGVDVYAIFNPFRGDLFGGGPSAVGLIALDVDVQWRHHFSDRFVGVTGVKLGAGVGGEDWRGLPIFGLTFGFQF